MSTTIPPRYAQSLLRLAAVPVGKLREEFKALYLPLVLLEAKAAKAAKDCRSQCA